MKRLAIIPLIVLFCLSLSGCHVLTDVSQYFAGLEDFVRGNPKSTVGIGGDGDGDGNGNGTVDPGPHTLTVVCFKRPLLYMRVYSDTESVDRSLDPDIASGIHFVTIDLYNGDDYFLELHTGQVKEDDLQTFYYGPFKIEGAPLTLMVMVNEKPDEDYPIREVRVVELPGSKEACADEECEVLD